MKKNVIVVNDCAHVFETLIPLLREKFNVKFITRTRGVWDKTFGIAWKILRSESDAVYHVNYALQDAYLVSKLKHLHFLTCHGSDARWTKETWGLGRMVKHNMKAADCVFYSTHDIEGAVNAVRPDATYMPNPVDTERFSPKQEYNDPPKAVAFKKWYDTISPRVAESLAKHNITFSVFDKQVPWSQMPETLRGFDIFVDQQSLAGWTKTAMEAMSTGLATVDFRHTMELDEHVEWLCNIDHVRFDGERNRAFILKNHDVKMVADKVAKAWEEVACT